MSAPHTPAWLVSASKFLADRGVHEPWIAEVSGHQLAAMSKRGRAAYEEKRRAGVGRLDRCEGAVAHRGDGRL